MWDFQNKRRFSLSVCCVLNFVYGLLVPEKCIGMIWICEDWTFPLSSTCLFVLYAFPHQSELQKNELNRWHRLNCPEAPKLIEKLVWHTKTPGSYQVVSMAPSFDNCCLKFRQQFRPHGPTKAVNYCVLHWKNSVLANHNSSQFMFSRPNISATIKKINEICI